MKCTKIKINTFLLVLMTLLLFIENGISQEINILGNVKDSKLLSDNIIKKEDYGVFTYKKDVSDYFIGGLLSSAYIKSVELYFIDKKLPKEVKILFSNDLFHWESVGKGFKYVQYKDGIKKLVIDTGGKTSKFIRFIFKIAGNEADIKISEIKVIPDKSIKVNKVELKVIEVNEYNVKIKVITDVDTISSIKYGTSLGRLSDGPVILDYAKENNINVTGFLRGTDYYIVAITRDCNGNIKYSTPLTVRTKGIPLPLINNINMLKVTSRKVEVEILCNVPVKYNVYYGYSPDKMEKASYSGFNDKHKFELNNVTPESRVYYKIEIIDKLGNSKISEILNSITLPNNIADTVSLEGDFNYIGENLGPVFEKNSIYRLVDNEYSYKEGSVMSGDIIAKEQEIFVDLKKEWEIKRIDLVWWALMYSTSFDVEVSVDKENWDVVRKDVGVEGDIRYNFSIPIPYNVSRIYIDKQVKYIRFKFHRNQYKSKFPQYRNLRLLEMIIIPVQDYKESLSVKFYE